VTFCVKKFSFGDSDPLYDYFVVSATAAYTLTGGPRTQAAPGYIDITSNKSASSNVFGGSPSYTSKTGCTTAFSVSAGVGPIGASWSPKLCSGFSVTRSSLGASGALFRIDKVGGATSAEVVYMQKVAKGTVPIYTVDLKRPTYTHVRSGATYKETAAWTTWRAIV